MTKAHLILLTPILLVAACKSDDSSRDASSSSSSMESREMTETSKPSPTNVAAQDREFVEKAAKGNMFEVRLSQLALDKDVSSATRDFANMMIRDHGKASDELAKLVRQKGINPTKSQLDADHQRFYEELSKLNGAEFDRRYRELQIRAHDEAIKVFEQAAERAQDPELRRFASSTVPTLRAHRRQLDTMSA